jgi:hypothetical protein
MQIRIAASLKISPMHETTMTRKASMILNAIGAKFHHFLFLFHHFGLKNITEEIRNQKIN